VTLYGWFDLPMRKHLFVIMNDLATINVAKDTTFGLLLEGQRRGYRLFYLNAQDLWFDGPVARARSRPVAVRDDAKDWFDAASPEVHELGQDDLIVMRTDPPVDADYINATFVLDGAERNGARVINAPRALRDFNEKLATLHFPALIPATRVAADAGSLREFVFEQGRAVLKPLDGMGGRGIFLTGADDQNLNVIIETLTDNGRHLAMAQEFLPAIADGDKRILMVHGQPVDYLLARIPGQSDFRGNLARGGRGEGRPLADSDRRIAEQVGPWLLDNGIELAGLDVIGDRLTEINHTSPTCMRELDRQFEINIAADFFAAVDP